MSLRTLLLLPALLTLVQADLAVPADANDRGGDDRPLLPEACSVSRLPPVDAITAVYEPEFEMHFGVPEGWRRVQLSQPSGGLLRFSVAYESRQTGADDRFADYVMIELIEGTEGGGFVASVGDPREARRIDGHPAVVETIRIPEFPVADTTLDLFVRQAGLSGPGYHIGLYAIGECGEEATMREAFAVLIETFRLARRPFDAF